jgi:hypothetical protein
MKVTARLQWTTIALTGVLALLVRYLLIEPADIAHLCEPAQPPWWCAVRMGIIQTFARYGLGYACWVAAVAALLSKAQWTAWTAAVLGVLGLTWYCQEPGAVSLLIGILRLARLHKNAADGRNVPTADPSLSNPSS